MKNIYLIIGLAAGISFSSCSDFLDKAPGSALPSEGAITSVFDLQNAVNGVGYIVSEGRMTYSAEFGIYADLMSGNFKVIRDYGQSSPISYYAMTKNDALPDYGYYYYYKALANANKALSYLDNVTGDETQIKNLHGQLLAWRGLLHFDLARMFCHIPTTVSNLDEANSGLVLSTEAFEADYKGSRSTLKQTYDQIIQDLTDALPLLSKSKSTGYLNYYGALALRARAYLYYGKNDLALTDAKAIIESGAYNLYSRAEYPNVWVQEGTAESIFELLITDNYNAQRNSLGYYTDATGYPECGFNTDSELFKYLKNNSQDIRSTLIKDQTAASYKTSAGYYPAKYPGRNGSIYVNNPKIIRLSEIYLIAAEAAYHLSGGDAAATYLNTIRKNRIEGYEDVSSVTLEDILFEYEKELFAENQTTFAYWRNKKSVTPAMITDVINYNDYRTIMPIPQREIDLNSALIQNPQY